LKPENNKEKLEKFWPDQI